MISWKKNTLDNLLTLIIDHRGKTPKKLGENWQETGIPAISANNIKNGSIIRRDTIKYVTQRLYKSWMKEELRSKDIILTSEGKNWGELMLLEKEFKFVLSQRLYALRCNENKIIPQFLYYYLKSSKGQFELKSRQTGSTAPGIRQSLLREVNVTYPDKDNQKQISSVLLAYDKLIENNIRRIEILEEMAQRIYKEWFVHFKYPGHDNDKLVDSELGLIPDRWKVGTLKDIAIFSNGYAFKSKELLRKNTGTCYHIFKMGHIKKGGGFEDTKTKSFIDKSKCEKLEKYILKYGDLLMCMTDMKANVALLGHTALMNVNDEYILNQRVGLIRAKNDYSINFPYLYILTNSKSFINDLRSRANSGVQVNLSTSEIKATKVLIPPKDINLKFDAIARPIRDVITKYQKKNKNLRLTRDYLLPKLISGKVDVSDLDIDTGILDD